MNPQALREFAPYGATGAQLWLFPHGRRPTKLWKRQAWKRFDQFARTWEPRYWDAAHERSVIERSQVLFLWLVHVEPQPIVEAASVELRLSGKQGPEESNINEFQLARFYSALKGEFNKYHDEWLRRFRQLNASLTNIVGIQVAGEIGIQWNVFNENVVAAIEARTNLLAGNVPDATFRGILGEIEAGLRAGDTHAQITARIGRVFDEGITIQRRVRISVGPDRGKIIKVNRFLGSEARNRMIARTETTAMTNRAAVESVRQAKIPYLKFWITQGDDRVREEHFNEEADSADGIPLEGEFPNTGLTEPGEPNCRCTLFFELPDKSVRVTAQALRQRYQRMRANTGHRLTQWA